VHAHEALHFLRKAYQVEEGLIGPVQELREVGFDPLEEIVVQDLVCAQDDDSWASREAGAGVDYYEFAEVWEKAERELGRALIIGSEDHRATLTIDRVRRPEVAADGVRRLP
jgi:hypothetical protein